MIFTIFELFEHTHENHNIKIKLPPNQSLLTWHRFSVKLYIDAMRQSLVRCKRSFETLPAQTANAGSDATALDQDLQVPGPGTAPIDCSISE